MKKILARAAAALLCAVLCCTTAFAKSSYYLNDPNVDITLPTGWSGRITSSLPEGDMFDAWSLVFYLPEEERFFFAGESENGAALVASVAPTQEKDLAALSSSRQRDILEERKSTFTAADPGASADLFAAKEVTYLHFSMIYTLPDGQITYWENYETFVGGEAFYYSFLSSVPFTDAELDSFEDFAQSLTYYPAKSSPGQTTVALPEGLNTFTADSLVWLIGLAGALMAAAAVILFLRKKNRARQTFSSDYAGAQQEATKAASSAFELCPEDDDQLKSLLEAGLITPEEYKEQRRRH